MADEPKIQELIRASLHAWQREMHFALPGKVKSYDAATQRAEVIPVVRGAVPKAAGGFEEEELPVLSNVPVRWPKAGGCYIHFPMVAGDWVELLFNEAAIGHWLATGITPSPPGDLSRNSLSYPYALPCAGPDSDVFADAPASAEAVISLGSNVLRVGEPSGSQFVALANLVTARLDAIQAAFDAHTHLYSPGPSPPAPTAPPASPIGALAAVAATKLKTK